MQVVTGPLGRPCLRLGEFQGPAISFSESGGKVWAALCGGESAIGIDVAAAGDFQGAYPHYRVFHPSELEHALGLTNGDWAGASALLWSIKEAAVKALGCGFHLVDPRHITVAAAVQGSGLTFPVGLSGPAQNRFPLAASRPLWVRSLPQDQEWVSIAYLQPSPSAHG
jgi:phosphopantetheinyl transferase